MDVKNKNEYYKCKKMKFLTYILIVIYQNSKILVLFNIINEKKIIIFSGDPCSINSGNFIQKYRKIDNSIKKVFF